ncbi:Aspartate aminotransferase [Posidoniimonas polymericola]|uniref:Aminotransferase n=1 Tax=Posidoniimonas polymericola TaxID=2528002 RepID=A0A5C5ZER1_9BACT|nr:amino acid aminotransferase [Posidoniimonas polymericola]TWT85646.1 Aspartate aminotransferase [Posidoniimonas polymericola]
MFESVSAAPPDAILGLTDAYKADPNPEKINLGVGVYQDEQGRTPVLGTVRAAAARLAADLASKSYLPITGSADYAEAVQKLMFGDQDEIPRSRRAVTAHTPGGTGALRVTADFIRQNFADATVWMSQPTWANHPAVFAAAGVPTKTYPYFDKASNGLNFEEMIAALKKIPEGDVVLLHGCCHNPTGIDPTAEQWAEIAKTLRTVGALPLIDFAYQGFGEGVKEDTAGLQAFCRPGEELIVCSSFSKNFGLYRERVGAATFVAADQDSMLRVASQVKRAIRSNYSNPPSHGAELVVTILQDAKLRKQWEGEVAEMRDRINGMRTLLVEKLAEHGAPGDFEFIKRQKGMFSFSGLTPDQVERLKNDYAIYIVGSGRINVAGITPSNVDRLAKSMADVLKG